jgi:hypothetical protein
MKKVVASFLLALGFTSLMAETRLSGELQVASLAASGNPYLVEKDISVPAGKSLTIKEGCVFLFSGFSGLNVSGNISVEGSTQQPVIFTCINDNDFNPKSQQLPNPFDWNGIIIAKESGSVHFQNFQLRYSVYGIKSQNTSMTIQNGIFRQNGQFHYTLNDKIQYVQDNISYSFNAATDSDKKNTDGSSSSGAQKSGAKTRSIIRYVSLGVGVAGIIGGTIFAMKASNTSKDIDNFKPEAYKTIADGDAKWKELDSSLKSQRTLTAVCFGIGGIGVIGFTASFFF